MFPRCSFVVCSGCLTLPLGGPVNLEMFLGDNGIRGPRVLEFKECCILPLQDVELDTAMVGPEEEDEEDRFLVVYRFGGVVFFGSPVNQHEAWLTKVENHLVKEKGQTEDQQVKQRLHDGKS